MIQSTPIFEGLCSLILKERPDLTMDDMEGMDFQILLDREGFAGIEGYIVPLSEAKKAFAIKYPDKREVDDFVYLRRFGVVVCNVSRHSSHEIFAGSWFRIIKHLLEEGLSVDAMMDKGSTNRGEAELFLHAGYGLYQTRAFQMRQVLYSTEHPLNAQEKMVFKGLDLRPLNPKD